MRKMIAVLLAGVMVLSLGACGSKDAGAVETAGSEEAVGQSAAAEGTEAAGTVRWWRSRCSPGSMLWGIIRGLRRIRN